MRRKTGGAEFGAARAWLTAYGDGSCKERWKARGDLPPGDAPLSDPPPGEFECVEAEEWVCEKLVLLSFGEPCEHTGFERVPLSVGAQCARGAGDGIKSTHGGGHLGEGG